MQIDVYRGEWNETAERIYATSMHAGTIAAVQLQMAAALDDMAAQLHKLREEGGSLITRQDSLLVASIITKVLSMGQRMESMTRRLNGTPLVHGT